MPIGPLGPPTYHFSMRDLSFSLLPLHLSLSLCQPSLSFALAIDVFRCSSWRSISEIVAVIVTVSLCACPSICWQSCVCVKVSRLLCSLQPSSLYVSSLDGSLDQEWYRQIQDGRSLRPEYGLHESHQ